MGPTDETKAEFLNDTGEVHAVWFGFLTAVGLLDLAALVPGEIENLYVELHYFCLGILVAAVAVSALLGTAVGLLVVLAIDPRAGFLSGAVVAAWSLLTIGVLVLPRCRDDIIAHRIPGEGVTE